MQFGLQRDDICENAWTSSLVLSSCPCQLLDPWMFGCLLKKLHCKTLGVSGIAVTVLEVRRSVSTTRGPVGPICSAAV